MSSEQEHGITGAVIANLPIRMTMVAFSTIALYNVIELNFIIYSTFKQRRGLYFWSFIVATWGIVPHTLGFVFKFFDVTSIWWLPVGMVGVGWFGMVSGQSVVLYSRLHLIVRAQWRIRWVLYMILFNAIVVGIPLMVLAFLTNRPGTSFSVINAFLILDKIQIGIFFGQECIISIIYIYETVRLLGSSRDSKDSPIGKLLTHIILVNILVLIFDATLLGTQYSGNFEIQTTYKSAIYSIKLKIEFSILNRLVGMVKKKGFEFSSDPNSSAVTHPLETWTNATTVAGRNDSVGNTTIKEPRSPRDKATELALTPTDWSGQTLHVQRPEDTAGGVYSPP